MIRLESNADYRIVERRAVCREHGLDCDQTLEFTTTRTRRTCPTRLRRIGYRDTESGKGYVFLANHLDLSTKAIAEVMEPELRASSPATSGYCATDTPGHGGGRGASAAPRRILAPEPRAPRARVCLVLQ